MGVNGAKFKSRKSDAVNLFDKHDALHVTVKMVKNKKKHFPVDAIPYKMKYFVQRHINSVGQSNPCSNKNKQPENIFISVQFHAY